MLKQSPEALQATLKQRGYAMVSSSDTLASVAAASGVPAMKLLFDVMPAR